MPFTMSVLRSDRAGDKHVKDPRVTVKRLESLIREMPNRLLKLVGE